MFAGINSSNTPGVKVWNFTNQTSFFQVALEDDCAPIHIVVMGNCVPSFHLPATSVAGKTITIKVERGQNPPSGIGTFYTQVYDRTATNNTYYMLPPPMCATFVYVPTSISGLPVSAGAWVRIDGVSSVWAGENHSVILGSGGAPGWDWPGGIGGGASNCVMIGGISNRITSGSGNSVCIGGGSTGLGNNVGAGHCVNIGGDSNSTSFGYSTVVGGQSNSATGSHSVSSGLGNAANGNHSSIRGGSRATTRSIAGLSAIGAHSSVLGTTQGLAQSALINLARETANATATALASNTSGASTSNQLTLPNNSAYFVRGSVIATVTGGGDTRGWTFDAVIKRGANAASTELVGAPSITSNFANSGASAWVVDVTADTTSGALRVTVTGEAGRTIRWVCELQSTEVTF
jgi:hypothetical protein